MTVTSLLDLPAILTCLGMAGWPMLGRAQASDVPDSVFVRRSYTKHEFRIPMRDGARLFTAVYQPNDVAPARRYPIVLLRTPFSIAPYGPTAYPRMLGPDRFMLRDKYIFVYQDVRGRYMSEGAFDEARPFVPDAIKSGSSTRSTRRPTPTTRSTGC